MVLIKSMVIAIIPMRIKKNNDNNNNDKSIIIIVNAFIVKIIMVMIKILTRIMTKKIPIIIITIYVSAKKQKN